MDDRPHHIGVSSLRDGFKETAANDFASVGDTMLAQNLSRLADHVRLIEQRSSQALVCCENSRQQLALTTPDVRDVTKAAEVVGGDGGLDGAARIGRHGTVENRIFIWTGAAILPYGLTVEMPKGILAGADAVFKMAPGLPGVRSADICRPAVEWGRRV